MSALSNLVEVVNEWLNFNHKEELVVSWVRMAEENLNETLRCKHMVQIDTGNVVNSRVAMPNDWLELDFVRVLDGAPLVFRSRYDFYANPSSPDNVNAFTLSGNYLMVNGTVPDGKVVEITYYQNIPPLEGTNNWLMQYYFRLYLSATLAVAHAYELDTDKASMQQTATQLMVDKINENSVLAETNGSRLVIPRKKGFG
jgi:hypothetical protein